MIWIATTADEYELPLAQADSSHKLADKLGVNNSTVFMLYKRQNTSKYTFNGEHYKVVRVDE